MMALAYVLWVVALLSLLVGGLETASRNQLLLTRNLVETAKAKALTDGAMNLVLAELTTLPPDAVQEGTRRVVLRNSEVRVTIADIGGRIDINRASPDLLARVISGAGAPAELALDLTAGIMARRGRAPDLEIAEEDEDRLDATTRPFLLLDELMQVPGMSSSLYDRLGELLTTQGGHRGVDPAIASPLIIRSVAGSSAAAETYLERRATSGRFAPLTSPHTGPVVGAGFELRAETRTGSGGSLARIMVVKPALPTDQTRGMRVVDWRTARGS